MSKKGTATRRVQKQSCHQLKNNWQHSMMNFTCTILKKRGKVRFVADEETQSVQYKKKNGRLSSLVDVGKCFFVYISIVYAVSVEHEF
jgi:hypothetical protein